MLKSRVDVALQACPALHSSGHYATPTLASIHSELQRLPIQMAIARRPAASKKLSRVVCPSSMLVCFCRSSKLKLMHHPHKLVLKRCHVSVSAVALLRLARANSLLLSITVGSAPFLVCELKSEKLMHGSSDITIILRHAGILSLEGPKHAVGVHSGGGQNGKLQFKNLQALNPYRFEPMSLIGMQVPVIMA